MSSHEALAALPYNYVGGELELFEHAVHWKSYFRRCLRRWTVGRVLEVGAGLGGTTRILCDGTQESWTALEPDAELLVQFRQRQQRQPFSMPIELVQGDITDLAGRCFDCLLYIDVLEHIEADADELRRAADLLAPGGTVVVLAPAHQRLYTPFDRAIGHYRRYSRADLRALTPATLRLERLFYLDSVGLLASLANRLWMKQSMPTMRQVQVWDRFFVPVSRWLDPLVGYRLGKTVVGVWRRLGS
jgi:2-polyprenyl-3-methyl-5-hydroxy-6-metoxy-1,4-benzoquinol methylase